MGYGYREWAKRNLSCLRLMDFCQVNKPHDRGVLTAYIKGAPERVLSKCSTYLEKGEQLPVTDSFKTSYDEAYNVRSQQSSARSSSDAVMYSIWP